MSVAFRGGRTCSCVATSLPYVEADMLRRGLIKTRIDIYQLGYRSDVAASAGTHSAGGCVDVGQYNSAQIGCWRSWGWTMQDRSPYFSQNHAHGWPYRCPHLSPAAQRQEDDWNHRDAGLAGSVRVVGQWPIKPWKTALEERKVGLLEDIADKLAGDTEFKNAVRDAVNRADVVPNLLPHAPGQDHVMVISALAEIRRDVREIKARLEGPLV